MLKRRKLKRLLAYDRNANFGQEDIDEDEVYSVPGPESFRDINSSSILPQLTKVHIQAFVDRFQAKMKGRQMYESRFLLTARSTVDGNATYIQGQCKAQMKKIMYVVNIKLNSMAQLNKPTVNVQLEVG
ncbi:hypothetical protein K1T71_014896 [Dendrolimus kikuchii]|nr:hypothetical protein K1T71_014896 [Dendrolimus kikuchii]